MAITTSVKKLAPGIGSADFYVSNVGNTLTSGSGKTVRLPSGSASFSPTAGAGKIRVKITQGTSGTSQITLITGTDGTTTVILYQGDANAGAANQMEELLVDFMTDLNLTSITVTATIGVASATADAEVIYVP